MNGPMDLWNGPMDQWTNEWTNKWTDGPNCGVREGTTPPVCVQRRLGQLVDDVKDVGAEATIRGAGYLLSSPLGTVNMSRRRRLQLENTAHKGASHHRCPTDRTRARVYISVKP